jgi:hypothetical protein
MVSADVTPRYTLAQSLCIVATSEYAELDKSKLISGLSVDKIPTTVTSFVYGALEPVQLAYGNVAVKSCLIPVGIPVNAGLAKGAFNAKAS